MSYLILGGSGLVGSELCEVLKERGHQYWAPSHEDLDLLAYGSLEEAIKRLRPSVVVNLVAIPSINPCEEKPDDAFSLHVTAPYHMAKVCDEIAAVFVQASSHAVFDGVKSDPYTENDEPNPLNVYGMSKVASEILLRNTCSRHYILRFASMYGKRRNASAGFVDKMKERIQAGALIKVADDKTDSPTYAKDVASEMVNLLDDSAEFGTYHVANQGNISYYDFVVELQKLIGGSARIDRAKDSDFPALGKKPLRTALSTVKRPPLQGWREALTDYVETLI